MTKPQLRQPTKAQKRLAARRQGFDVAMASLKSDQKSGYRKPGSLNPRKQ